MNVYVIYDRKAETVRSLFTADNDVSCVRAVVSSVRQGSGDLTQFPTDFEVQCIGAVDMRLARIVPSDVNQVLGSVATLLAAAGGPEVK